MRRLVSHWSASLTSVPRWHAWMSPATCWGLWPRRAWRHPSPQVGCAALLKRTAFQPQVCLAAFLKHTQAASKQPVCSTHSMTSKRLLQHPAGTWCPGNDSGVWGCCQVHPAADTMGGPALCSTHCLVTRLSEVTISPMQFSAICYNATTYTGLAKGLYWLE